MGAAIRVRVTVTGLRRKIARARAGIPKTCERELRKLAEEAVDLIRNAPENNRRAFFAQTISHQFSFVFVPVALKHKRPEKWPNLHRIYNARIVRGQGSFQGRRLFYVDENKEEALFEEIVSRAMNKQEGETFEVRFVRTYDNRFRVEIISRGRGIPPAMIAFAKHRMKQTGGDALRESLDSSGLR